MGIISRWDRPIYELRCPECHKISLKSFRQLETKDRLPCDHCGIGIKVTDYYGQAELYAIAVSLGSPDVILRDRKKGE